MTREEATKFVRQYEHLRDVQFAAYELYARRYGLTAKELFVLFIIWSTPEGCLQADIAERLSATQQTISAIVKKFWKLGYLSLTESETDRRNKIVRLTETGQEYTDRIIAPPTEAEIDAMMELDDRDIAELVRLTTQFSTLMKEKFNAIETKEI